MPRQKVFRLAECHDLLVRTADGKLFIVAEIDDAVTDEDFADEVARTRENPALRELLASRSQEPGAYSLEQVREKLGLPPAAD